VSYASVGTFFLGRPVGLAASEWIIKTLQSPATRRLLSSRTENA
jgi:hypothetical protein